MWLEAWKQVTFEVSLTISTDDVIVTDPLSEHDGCTKIQGQACLILEPDIYALFFFSVRSMQIEKHSTLYHHIGPKDMFIVLYLLSTFYYNQFSCCYIVY